MVAAASTAGVLAIFVSATLVVVGILLGWAALKFYPAMADLGAFKLSLGVGGLDLS